MFFNVYQRSNNFRGSLSRIISFLRLVLLLLLLLLARGRDALRYLTGIRIERMEESGDIRMYAGFSYDQLKSRLSRERSTFLQIEKLDTLSDKVAIE